MDLIQGSGNMDTLTNPGDSTASSPRWVLLNRNSDDDDSDSTADAMTTAASWTSTGLPFTVSFSVTAPPAASSIHGRWAGGAGVYYHSHAHNGDGEEYSGCSDDGCSYDALAKDSENPELEILAAHDDAVLIEIRVPARDSYSAAVRGRRTVDYFLYEAGAGRTPSLSLLPRCYISVQRLRAEGASDVPTLTSRVRNLGGGMNDTGILRRGNGEVLVVKLEVEYNEPYTKAELCLLCTGVQDWVIEEVPIVHHQGEGVLVSDWTVIDAAVPVGSRFMCWVDYLSGILLCDMAEVDENTKLLYVPLPPETRRHEYNKYYKDRPQMQYCRNLAAAGPGAVRLVSIAPRCCCGGPCKTLCKHSSFAFNETTWTLALRMEEPMVWVKDAVLDCDELWRLDNYGLLPRVAPQYPIVSSDDPDIVCFKVCENHYFIDGADETVWMVEINTRSKALLSVVRSDNNEGDVLPATLRW